MKITVIADEDTIEDSKKGIGQNYLINKILKDDRFSPNYVKAEDIGKENVKIDIVLLHRDKTVQLELKEALKTFKGIKVINENLLDTSKRKIEEIYNALGGPKIILTKRDSYRGLVFIKSNYNGSDPRGNWYKCVDYNDIDPQLWEREDIVIQKYISSKQNNGFNLVRRYILCLGEVVCCSLLSKDVIVKRGLSILQYYRDSENINADLKSGIIGFNEKLYQKLYDKEVKDINKIKKFAQKIGMEFGAIEAISSGDNLYILDVNPTPWEKNMPEEFVEIFRKKLLTDCS